MVITDKTIVALRYKMKNSKGETLEDIMRGTPVRYLQGAGNILPALEGQLAGLKAGDKKSIIVSKENSFPDVDDDFHFEVVIDDVRLTTEEELIAGGPNHQDQTTADCGPDCCC